MIKIVFRGSAPFVGTDYAYVEEFEEMPSERELDEMAWEYACDNAKSYGSVFEGDEDEYDPSEFCHFLADDIGGWWEIYDPETHDGILG
jgi:hypothetical protein